MDLRKQPAFLLLFFFLLCHTSVNASPLPGTWELLGQPDSLKSSQLSVAILRDHGSSPRRAWFLEGAATLDSVLGVLQGGWSNQCKPQFIFTLQDKKGQTWDFPVAKDCLQPRGAELLSALLLDTAQRPDAHAYVADYSLGFRLDKFVKATSSVAVLDKTRGRKLENGSIMLVFTPIDSLESEATDASKAILEALRNKYPFAHQGQLQMPADSARPLSFALMLRFYDNRYFPVSYAWLTKQYPYKITESLRYLPKVNQVAFFSKEPLAKVKSLLRSKFGAPKKISMKY